MKKNLLIILAMTAIAIESCAPKLPQTRKDDTVDNYFGTEVAGWKMTLLPKPQPG